MFLASFCCFSQVADQAGLQNKGQIGQLKGHYLLCSGSSDSEALGGLWTRSAGEVLAAHPQVLWFSKEMLLSRSKRSVAFNDPNYPKQWHLVRACTSYKCPLNSNLDLLMILWFWINQNTKLPLFLVIVL